MNQSSTSHRGGPDIIDSMKPAFFFNVRHNQDSIKKLKAEEKKDGVSMTPCFINTPSNSSQFGSLNGTGSLDPLILSDAI